jgi:hypothetical protein
MPLRFIKMLFYAFKTLFIFFLLLPLAVFPQGKVIKPGSLAYLKLVNGYNGIVLGSEVTQLTKSKLEFLDGDSKLDADSCLKLAFNDTTVLKVGKDLYLDMIGLRTYKNRIVNIYVFFKKSDGYKVFRDFLTTFGLFTSKPNDYADIYNWTSANVDLSLRYEDKVDLGVAVFTCNPLLREMAVVKIRPVVDFLSHIKYRIPGDKPWKKQAKK